MNSYWINTYNAFNEVFSRIEYMVLAGTLAALAFVFAVLLPNTQLIVGVFRTSSASIATKTKLVISLLGSIHTNFTVLSAGYTIAIAILFGLNIAMIVYLTRKRRQLGGKTISVGMSGLVSGLFGVGCASCGAFLLTAVLSSIGAVGILAYLPLQGGELGLIGVALLAISLVLISKKITQPLMCKI